MDKVLELKSTTLYDGLLTIREDGLVAICDEEFESSISFSNSSISELIESYRESPEYFTNDILISVYHYFTTTEVAHANEIMREIERKIVGRDTSENIDYALDFIEDGYEWIELEMDEQKEVFAKNTKENISK